MKLTWLESDTPFPPVENAWGLHSEAPGLLAAGADLSPARLLDAYRHGIFPWYSEGQPILWWSTDPRMVLRVQDFHVRRSFAKVLRGFIANPGCEIRVDSAFEAVIQHCAATPRPGQSGTWITHDIQSAYTALHAAGYVHSVETWCNGKLVGGLYCVAIGQSVFGESMFSHATDASKIALAALVALCRNQEIEWIDCQQNTGHLASMGARTMAREAFVRGVRQRSQRAPARWAWNPLYWNAMGFSQAGAT
jgi:leucyl/phenylalanyl-tRNA--protein transferase